MKVINRFAIQVFFCSVFMLGFLVFPSSAGAVSMKLYPETGYALLNKPFAVDIMLDSGGEDVVGIGTDFDGFTAPPDDLDNASQMPRLTQRLVADGHNEMRIKKVLGGNALRVIRQGWGR
jgi:hypothetical protein